MPQRTAAMKPWYAVIMSGVVSLMVLPSRRSVVGISAAASARLASVKRMWSVTGVSSLIAGG